MDKYKFTLSAPQIECSAATFFDWLGLWLCLLYGLWLFIVLFGAGSKPAEPPQLSSSRITSELD
jgi:hypothetical protein